MRFEYTLKCRFWVSVELIINFLQATRQSMLALHLDSTKESLQKSLPHKILGCRSPMCSALKYFPSAKENLKRMRNLI